MLADPPIHRARERFAIDHQRAPARHPGLIGTFEEQAAQHSQLGFEQAVRGGELDRFERIGAHQLGKPSGLVRRGHDPGTHLDQGDLDPAFGQGPGRFAASQASA